MSRTEIVLFGATGRMGAAIDEVVAERPDVAVSARVDDVSAVGDVSRIRGGAIVDFSTPLGAREALRLAVDHNLAFVSGTTGLPPAFFEALDAASAEIPVLHAANMSLGVTVLRDIVRRAAAALPPSFEPEIFEVHHRHKVDAPSGTALALADAVNAGRGRDDRGNVVTARSGAVGPRGDAEIGVCALRGGDVTGEHTVFFFGAGERIEITHRATDRRIFARGAVAAAAWIVGRPPGRYTIADVVGLD